MREELVENGLKFLQHPNVQSTPLSERVSFLEGKGMTKEEIQESIERHQKQGSGTTVAASAPNAAQQNYLAPPMMMNAAAPMQMMHYQAKYPAYVRVLWTISSLVGAASILTFLWNYAVQSGYIPWLRPVAPLLEAAKVQKEKEQEAKKDEALLAELSSVSSAIQKQTEELTRISSSLEKKEHDVQSKLAKVSKSLAEHGNARAIAELKAEVSTLKMLMFSKTSDGVIGIEDIIKTTKIAERKAIKAAAMVNPQQPPSVVSQMAMKAEQMEKTLKKFRTENSIEQLKLAAGVLSMYVKNLIENPDIPRYRRISPGNANFKQKIEPLKHHEELLKSIGFEMAGLNMEWKWHTASKTTGAMNENIALLRALLKALESLTHPQSTSTNLSLEEIVHESLEEFLAEQDKREQSVALEMATKLMTETSQENNFADPSSESLFDGSSASAAKSLDAFMTRLEQQNSVSNIANAKTKLSSSSLSELIEAAEEEKMPSFEVSSISSNVKGDPSYPESFQEVLKVIQSGETVPGIHDIEDKLSVDSSVLLSQPMKVSEGAMKPW